MPVQAATLPMNSRDETNLINKIIFTAMLSTLTAGVKFFRVHQHSRSMLQFFLISVLQLTYICISIIDQNVGNA